MSTRSDERQIEFQCSPSEFRYFVQPDGYPVNEAKLLLDEGAWVVATSADVAEAYLAEADLEGLWIPMHLSRDQVEGLFDSVFDGQITEVNLYFGDEAPCVMDSEMFRAIIATMEHDPQ